MREVLQHFGSSPTQAIAIRDSANDFELVREADMGITLAAGAKS